MTDSHPPNRLINETSPYLLQHAYNPVDWYPWGEEALQLAREQNRPIFLSIGYSACHWCHVMERESFENPQIAELMNQWFVNIKVDREERPDLDQIYMTAVQLITGHGGWPMSVFLFPDGKPFFGGTYWPPESRPGMVGFPTILSRIHQIWEQDQQQCQAKASELVEEIGRLHHEERVPSPLNEELLKHAQHRLLQSIDPQEGGFGNAPKFPHPVDLRVLLRTWQRFQEPAALNAVALTLDKMSAGGIYDHLGGGFARYSVDRYWLVPHFEKMLYDNSQLVVAYLEGYQATKNEDYLRTVRETLDYILREMTSPAGGFYSTQDADSEGVEGKFYVWSAEEIEQHLTAEQARAVFHCYQVSPAGNWEGHNILHRKSSWQESADQLGLTTEELEDVLSSAREKLLAIRNQRIAPGRDEKMIVAWNGLMLSAFAQASRVLNDQNYLEAATRNADFLLRELRREDGTLWHCRMANRNQINGFLDDYACLIDGLSDLYLATLKTEYYQAAIQLAEKLIDQFYDEESSSLNYTPKDHEELVVRVRDRYDSAIPSGSNLAIFALLKLGKISGREDFVKLAEECLQTVSGTIRMQPSGMGQALLAVDFSLGPEEELVLCSGSTPVEFEKVSQHLLNSFRPQTLLFLSTAQTDSSTNSNGSPLLSGKKSVSDQLTLYRCQRGYCEAPVTGIENITENLSAKPE